jgi:hypothetical protein
MGNAFFFGDEHNFTEIWLVWDAILAHRANANVFVSKLSITHLLQVPIGTYEALIEDLQRNRLWNVPELIARKEEEEGRKPVSNHPDL